MDLTAPKIAARTFQAALDPIMEYDQDAEALEVCEDGEPEAKRQRIGHDCDLCDKSYIHRKSLLVHLRSPMHCRRAGLTVPDLSCALCPKLAPFARKDILDRHMREVHKGIKRTKARQVPAARPPIQHDDIPNGHASAEIESVDISEIRLSALSVSTPSVLSTRCSMPTTTSLPKPSMRQATRDAARTVSIISAIDAHATLSQRSSSDNVLIIDQEQVPENASLDSGDSANSSKSFLSACLPTRIEIFPDIGSRIPPSMPRHFVQPCPLCRKELGKTIDDGKKVWEHLDVHLQEMTNPQWEISCTECRVSFVHRKDLEWHLNCVETNGHCGFCKEPDMGIGCKGHHPPCSDTVLEESRRQFVVKLRDWENLQLQNYSRYVEDYQKGRVLTNAPPSKVLTNIQPYRGPLAFRRSTGSLSSLRTCSTFSTIQSAPGDSLARSPRLSKSVKKLSTRISALTPGGVEKALLRAIKQRDLLRWQDASSPGSLVSLELALLQAVGASDGALAPESLSLALNISLHVTFGTAISLGHISISRCLLSAQPKLQYLSNVDDMPDIDVEQLIVHACRTGNLQLLRILIESDSKIVSYILTYQVLLSSLEENPRILRSLLEIALEYFPHEYQIKASLKNFLKINGGECIRKLLVHSFTLADHGIFELVLLFGQHFTFDDRLEHIACSVLGRKGPSYLPEMLVHSMVALMNVLFSRAECKTLPDTSQLAVAMLQQLENPDVLEGLLQSGQILLDSSTMRHLLSAAAFHGYLDIIRSMLNAGVNHEPPRWDLERIRMTRASTTDCYALSWAIRGRHKGIVELLLSKGAQLPLDSEHVLSIPEDIKELLRDHARKQLYDPAMHRGNLSDWELLHAGGVLVA